MIYFCHTNYVKTTRTSKNASDQDDTKKWMEIVTIILFASLMEGCDKTLNYLILAGGKLNHSHFWRFNAAKTIFTC